MSGREELTENDPRIAASLARDLIERHAFSGTIGEQITERQPLRGSIGWIFGV